MKGEAYQGKQAAGANGGQVQQRKRGGKGGKGGKGGRGVKAQLDRLEKKLGWGGFDDKLPPEKVGVLCLGCLGQGCGWLGGMGGGGRALDWVVSSSKGARSV